MTYWRGIFIRPPSLQKMLSSFSAIFIGLANSSAFWVSMIVSTGHSHNSKRWGCITTTGLRGNMSSARVLEGCCSSTFVAPVLEHWLVVASLSRLFEFFFFVLSCVFLFSNWFKIMKHGLISSNSLIQSTSNFSHGL